MTVEELIIYGRKFLHSHEVNILLAGILGYDTLELLTHLDLLVSDNDVNKFKNMIESRKNGYPLQYIIGSTCFYGYDFLVNPNVLIPRFETEQLVEIVIKYIDNHFEKPIKIIDLGCGSGAIGITLSKKIDNSEVTCLDISDLALDVTKVNADRLNANINIIKGDMLDNITDKYDVIVSNPPYISPDEDIEPQVKNYEPHLALYGGNDGLFFYEKILKNIQKNLNKKYLIAFEIGYLQKKSIEQLARKYLDDEDVIIETYKDLSGKDRIVLIHK